MDCRFVQRMKALHSYDGHLILSGYKNDSQQTRRKTTN